MCASDVQSGDDGVAVSDILAFANASSARNKLIVLDCCHAGVAGQRQGAAHISELSEGMTILTASTADQYAMEENGSGVFTTLLVDALEGAAANLLGDITPGSIYAHIDQSLGAWAQRPVFKTNVRSFVSLRTVQPPISLEELQKLPALFEDVGSEFPLDPSFEPEGECPNPENTAVFATLQKYNRVNLVVPVDAPHMWHAAMQSKSCKLTVLGEHYWKLAKSGRL